MPPSDNPSSATNPKPPAPAPPTNPQSPGLTPSQLASYHENGYLIIPNYLPASTISALVSETELLLSQFPTSTHPLTRFTTGTEEESAEEGKDTAEGTRERKGTAAAAHVGDDYFLTSGDKIRYFLEAGASFSPETGALTTPPHLAVNKIGHCLHELSPPFRSITLCPPYPNPTNPLPHSHPLPPAPSPTPLSISHSLGIRSPLVPQSMLILKPPTIGAPVHAHQDSTFLFTKPPSALGFWIALQDSGAGNGCLAFAAGSHRRRGVGSRLVRQEGGGTGFVPWEGVGFPDGEGEGGGEEGGEEVYTLGEVEKGSLVLIHGNLLHKSARNSSGQSRFAYTFHVIEGEHEYDERNWLQPPEKGFTRLY